MDFGRQVVAQLAGCSERSVVFANDDEILSCSCCVTLKLGFTKDLQIAGYLVSLGHVPCISTTSVKYKTFHSCWSKCKSCW